MTAELSAQVALVTGAGHPQGIGLAIARKLAEAGAAVVVTDVAVAEGTESVLAELEAQRVEVSFMPMDVSDCAAIEQSMAQVMARHGRLDILVNNAGVGAGAEDFLQTTPRDWQLSLDINLMGAVNCSRAALPFMLERNSGSIINIASLAGLGAINAIPACYTASKFAVIGLTKQLALNYADRGVRVNAVCPGSIVTRMYQQTLELIAEQNQVSLDEARAIEDASIPLGYSGAPDVVGDTVVYLASAAARYITGVSIPVAGGMAPGL